ncbi:MAG: CYTH domain-containing protein [Crocinitomicaceae bacterium]|nr:CYTH domain-containing protein [Crocinitomicaceae bacterium]
MLEIERKYLLETMDWKKEIIQSITNIKQAYLFEDHEKSVRIRVRSDQAFMTIKMGKGVTRNEFEYSIPVSDAEEMIEKASFLCLEKDRYVIEYQGAIWEIDVFKGKYEGLVLAEIELRDENQEIQFPTWIGEEVTNDPAYLNVNLFKNL